LVPVRERANLYTSYVGAGHLKTFKEHTCDYFQFLLVPWSAVPITATLHSTYSIPIPTETHSSVHHVVLRTLRGCQTLKI